MSAAGPGLSKQQLLVIGGGLLLVLPMLVVLGMGFGFDPHKIDSPLVGLPAPVFELPALSDQQPVKLASLQGKPAVINFWATWCASCPMEHPGLVQASRYYGEQVQFVGIAYEDKRPALKAWLNRNGGDVYPTLVDVGGKTAIAYGVYGVPETYILDEAGTVTYKHVGPIPPQVLKAELDRLL